MKKNNKNKNVPKKDVPIKDIFDVKENLKKLRSGSDNSSTKIEPFSNESSSSQHLSSEASMNQITGSQYYSSDKVDVLRDRIAIDISNITQKLDDHKDKTNERFSGEVLILRNEISAQGEKLENKISSYITKEWFAGVIGVTIIMATLIYNLSYSNVISDLDKLKNKQDEIEKKVEKNSIKIEYINKINTDSISSKSKK